MAGHCCFSGAELGCAKLGFSHDDLGDGMPIYMTARFKVRADALQQCDEAIREFVGYVELNEPRTRLYTSVQEAGDPTRFLHFFVFDDEAAQEAHANSMAVKRFTDILYPACEAPVEFTEYSLVATT